MTKIEEAALDYEDWIDSEADNIWVSRTLKLFLYTMASFSKTNRWCKWPDLVHTDDAQFFKKASAKLEDDIDNFDNYLCEKASEEF